MAVSHKLFSNAILNLGKKKIDLTADTLKVTLHTSSFTPAQTTMDFQNDLTNELSTANGYTAGGAALTTVGFTLSSLVCKLDADDVVWTVPDGDTLAAAYAVIADTSPGTSSTNPLISYVDFGGTVTVSPVGTTGSLTLTWNASGIATITVS